MAMFGIGKKKSSNLAAPSTADVGEGGAQAPAPPVKRGRSGKAAKPPVAAKKVSRKFSGDLDIYTAVLAAAFIALAAGCVLVAMDNLSGVEGTGDEGNPFAVLSSH